MISFLLTSPGATIDPGDTTFTIEISTTNAITEELTALLESSFVFSVNGVEAETSFEASVDGGVATVDLMILGGQTLTLLARGSDGEEGRAVWSVEVVDDCLQRVPDYVRSPYLDTLTSYLPDYIRAATTKESVFQQLANPMALMLERVKRRIVVDGKNTLILSADIQDPDWLFRYELSDNESFSYAMGPAGEFSATPPTCYGYLGINRLALASTESFEDLWTSALPTRLSFEDLGLFGGAQLTPSFDLVSAPELSSLKIPTKDKVFACVFAGTPLVDMAAKIFGEANIELIGLGPNGESQEEIVPLLESGFVSSNLQWEEILQIVPQITLDTLECEVFLSLFPPRLSPKQDPLYQETKDRVAVVQEFSLLSDELGTCLDKSVSFEGRLIDIARGQSTKDVISRSRLYDVEGEEVFLTDFCLNSSSPWLYGVDATKLYIWDRRELIPNNLAGLAGLSDEPEQHFSIEALEHQTVEAATPSQTITIAMEGPRANIRTRSWTWKITTPSGEEVYVDPVTGDLHEEIFSTDNPIPIEYFGIKQRDFDVTLDETGDYLIELELTHIDNTVSVFKRIFTVQARKALAQFTLTSHLSLIDQTNRIHCSLNGSLFLENGGKMWRVTPHYDTMLIDPDERSIYFRENYDKIEVLF